MRVDGEVRLVVLCPHLRKDIYALPFRPGNGEGVVEVRMNLCPECAILARRAGLGIIRVDA
jgi:hypothetical protein